MAVLAFGVRGPVGYVASHASGAGGRQPHITNFMSQVHVRIVLAMFTLTYLRYVRYTSLNTQFI